MSVVSVAAAAVARATSAGGTVRSGAGGATAAPVYADDLPTAGPVASTGAGWQEYIVIVDLNHPSVTMVWPADSPIPAGWMEVVGLRVADRTSALPMARATADLVMLSGSQFEALLRRADERAARDAAAQDAREQRLEQQRVARLTTTAARLYRAPRAPRPARASRPPRPPRAARPPRVAREPRPPRQPGTVKTKWGAWCRPVTPRCITSQGPCVAWPLNDVVPQGAGYCQGSILPSCRGCFQGGCTGPHAELVTSILKQLPKQFEQTPAYAPPPPRAVIVAPSGGYRQIRQLGPLAQADRAAYEQAAGAPGIGDITGGCTCQDWPGWVICPQCRHSAKCACSTKCIPFSAGHRLCGG
jgi:hypothetical protein